MSSHFKILFLTVNYFNEKEVCTFITNQLQPDKHPFIDIVITDNGSKNTALLHEIENKYVNVSLANSSGNKGYFGAANLGLTHYLSRYKEYPDAVIICNTDIALGAQFLNTLQNILASQNFDVLGPSIYSTFLKHYQNPYIIRRISKRKLKFLRIMSSGYLIYDLFICYHVLKTKLKGHTTKQATLQTKPYAIHGSFMIFNKSFFEKGGTIDYPVVLFGEEIFIGEQVLKLQLNMLYEPALQIEHHEHATTGVFKSRETIRYLHESYTYLLKTFF